MSRIADIAKTMKTWWNKDDDPFVHRALDEIIRIDQEQLLTIEPKRGEWIGEADGYYNGELIYDTWYCSNCDYVVDDEEPPTWNFCPNCGARMKGADDDY